MLYIHGIQLSHKRVLLRKKGAYCVKVPGVSFWSLSSKKAARNNFVSPSPNNFAACGIVQVLLYYETELC